MTLTRSKQQPVPFSAWGERFPNQVFNQHMGLFRFLSMIKFAQADFWRVLVQIGNAFGDDAIIMMTHEPTPFEYKKWMGVFGALRLPLCTTPQQYASAMKWDFSEGKRIPALYFSVSAVRWFGSSGSWGIYGNRDLDISIGAVSKLQQYNDGWPKISGSLWLSKQRAKDSVLTGTGYRADSERLTDSLFQTYSDIDP